MNNKNRIDPFDELSCCGCMACESVCPRGAISMIENWKGFIMPSIDDGKCVNCGLCLKVCDFKKPQQTESNIKRAYSLAANDKTVLKNSTSGGAFTALSNVVLGRSGCVVVSVMEDDFTIRHVVAEDKTGRDKMRGSKYVQSSTQSIWQQVKTLLSQGKEVCFTGTPCQCAALRSFLGKDYDNLVVVDFLCHGVPNNKMFKEHIAYLNKYYKKAPFYKFSKHNLHYRPISLKQQNYQCYICQKNFSMFFSIPIEQVFWCSYYMRFVCKNCIEDEYFIIPFLILKKWCFEKFSISKKAKNILLNWYDKPIIYFKNKDKLLRKTPYLIKIIEVKKSINNIFDFMKCGNKFKFVEETLGEYEYLALKEYIFSLRDLVEINAKIFYQKLKEFRNKFIKHISGECPECLFKGEICKKCGRDEIIYFYDFENVFHCKISKKSFHRKCIEFVSHVH